MLFKRIENLEKCAKEHGLIYLGCSDLDVTQDFVHFENWLAKKNYGDMAFLTLNQKVRKDPKKLLPGAQSAVLLAKNYKVPKPNRLLSIAPIASYAYYQDYHKILRQECLRFISACKRDGTLMADTDYRVTIDSAPLLERALARKGGRGFIGKNTLFISPRHGSFLLLASIILTEPLPANADHGYATEKSGLRHKDHGGCGSCRRCQIKCPTQALAQDYQLDVSRCLAYLTIENRGTIPTEYWKHLPRAFFGCDICQNVCPYNRETPVNEDWPRIIPERLKGVSTFEIAVMDQAAYEKWFAGTPLTRAKIFGLKRNALIVMYVTHDHRLSEALTLIKKAPEIHPVIRATVKQIEAYEVD